MSEVALVNFFKSSEIKKLNGLLKITTIDGREYKIEKKQIPDLAKLVRAFRMIKTDDFAIPFAAVASIDIIKSKKKVDDAGSGKEVSSSDS